MKDYLESLSKEIKGLINLASTVALNNKVSVYLVGGFVRDLILGVKNFDLDIVIEGNGIKFAEDFAMKLKARIIRHKRFGTATVMISPVLKVDIATARKESYPQPASLPVVSKGSLKDDLCRRDFTINAMALSIAKKKPVRLIDSFGGMQDLRQKEIRILHQISFIDDPTRILRAIRFEKRYGFQLEAQTLAALKEAVRLKMLEKVGEQRLRDEMIIILKEAHPLRQIRRIQELAGFGFIKPKLSLALNNFKFIGSLENEINWFKKEFPHHRQFETWLIYFIGLIDPLTIGEAKDLCKRFAFRREEEKNISAYKKINKSFIRQLSSPGIKPYDVFRLLKPLTYEVIILLKSKHRNLNLQKNIKKFFRDYDGAHLYITGDDLHRLGFAPGPDYRRILNKVLEAKLNGKVKTKKEELAMVISNYLMNGDGLRCQDKRGWRKN